MEENKMHFRHQKGKNATQATNKIHVVYGESALAERTIRKWFVKFRIGNFDLNDQTRVDSTPD